MSKLVLKHYELVYKTSTTPFFPICFCGRNYSVDYKKLAKVASQPEPVIAVIKDDTANWYFHKNLSKIAAQVMDRFFANEAISQKIFLAEKKLSRQLLHLIKKQSAQYFTKGILNKAGQKHLRDLFKVYTTYAYYADVPGFLFQLYYVDKYLSFIKKRAGKVKLSTDDLDNLLCLPSLTNFEKFNQEVVKLIQSGVTAKKIKVLQAKYYWILHDYLGDIVDVEYLIKYINKFQKHLPEEVRHIAEAKARIKRLNQTVCKLPIEARSKAIRLHKLMWLYNDRKKEVLNQVNIYIRAIIKTRFPKWGVKDLHKFYQFAPPEIITLLSESGVPDINSQAKSYVHQIINGEFSCGHSSAHTLTKNSKSTVLKGMVAMSGQISGRVNVVLNVSQISKFKKGDILIAPFTNVNYLPIMRQAKAIITETGGLTSHAAIVARELKKPCIIGVKNLISSVKDGQMISVDANHGLITKLD